jgi:hypothetical protein
MFPTPEMLLYGLGLGRAFSPLSGITIVQMEKLEAPREEGSWPNHLAKGVATVWLEPGSCS